MTFDAGLALGLLALAVALFLWDRLRSDVVSLIVLAVLLASGLVPTREAFSGFSHPATVTVAAMFVLSAALERSGAVDGLGRLVSSVGRGRPRTTLVVMMLGVAAISAFINNTAAVAILLPTVVAIARDTGQSPSKLLIPLSFASLFGGVCTLIGTSTNIVVSSIAADAGQRPLAMFELARLGVVLLAAGVLYMATLGRRLLPDRVGTADLASEFEVSSYLTEVEVLEGSDLAGRRLDDAPVVRDPDVDVLAIVRAGAVLSLPRPSTLLATGDVLWVRCDLERLRTLRGGHELRLRPPHRWSDSELGVGDATLVEVVVAPDSFLDGRTLAQARFRNRYGATVLAIRHRDRLVHTHLATTPLAAGDALLVEVRPDRLAQFLGSSDWVVVSERGSLEATPRRRTLPLAVAAGVVAAATAGLVDIAVAAPIGAILMVLTGCLPLEDAYRAIEWRVIVLLGGLLPLGLALDSSGAARLIADLLVHGTGDLGPTAALSALFLVTTLLSAFMSNNATAALLTPVALTAAAALQVDPRPFLLTVAVAASTSFMTPISYQTNLLVYGPGAYRFGDYVRVGAPLTVLFWLLGTLLIPVFWPF